MQDQLNQKVIQEALHAALRNWNTPGGTADDLLDFLLLVRQARAELEVDGSPAGLRLATNQVLLQALEALELHDHDAARVLRWRFADDNTLLMVGNRLNVSEHTVSRLQRAAIDKLAGMLLQREQEARAQQAREQEAFLPPPTYTRLFGVDTARAELRALLAEPEPPWIISLVGIGGIGKTALADAVVRDVIRTFRFEQVVWLRAEPQSMSGRSYSPQITFEGLITDLAARLLPDAAGDSPRQRLLQVRQALQASPHLVVIDNLEAEIDTAYLLAHLADLAGPGKFFLTSRTHPPEQAHVYRYALSELPLADASALMCRHAADTGVHSWDEANEADMAAIYQVTGGNPLALRLVVSLADVYPLPQILEALGRSRPGPIEALYRHIYLQAWQALSEPARTLLQAMPLIAETGGRPDYLQTISGLDDGQFWQAVQELRNRSLLEVRGTLHDKRYGIHRLTDSFLRTEIIRWPEEEEE